MSMRLKFKGDKKKKKKKRTHSERPEEYQPEVDEEVEGWVMCDRIVDFDGPLMIASTATDPLSILCAHEESSRVTWRKIMAPKAADMDEEYIEPSVSNIEPSHVYQVFVAHRIPGPSEDAPTNKVSLKSAYDMYLGVDKFGLVECSREAVGPTEEWEIIQREDGFALQSYFGKYLKVDLGDDKSSTMGVRADAESIGFLETLQFKCQAATKYKKKREEQKEKEMAEEDIELEQIKKFHSNSLGKVVSTKEDTRVLKKAKKDGKLNEALLERRSRLKSDKFCK